MNAYHLQDLIGRLDNSRPDIAEFFDGGRMRMSVARWPAGSTDPQHPHAEDEVYVVSQGRARLEVAGERVDVGPGSVLFVPAGVDHHFRDITEDLQALVVWARRDSDEPKA